VSFIERAAVVPSPDVEIRVDHNGAVLRIYQPACRADAVDICLSAGQLAVLLDEAKLKRAAWEAEQTRHEHFPDNVK